MHGADSTESELIAIGRVINDFHDAPAHGDKARYLDHLDEGAVFSAPEFKPMFSLSFV